MIDNNQAKFVVTDSLCQSYNYAFVETSTYNFTFPRLPQAIPAKIRQRVYHCLDCGEMLEVALKDCGNGGVVYPDKTRVLQQQALHEKLGFKFPEIQEDMAFVYRQEGYCPTCFEAMVWQGEVQPAQQIYKLCSQLIHIDCSFLNKAVAGIALAMQEWLNESRQAQESTKNFSNEQLVEMLTKSKPLADVLEAYRQQTEQLIARTVEQLAIIEDKATAYVGRPINQFESLCEAWYNEYTAIVPEESTPDTYFFVQSPIKKDRVEVFLRTPRIIDIEGLITETGAAEEWLEHSSNMQRE